MDLNNDTLTKLYKFKPHWAPQHSVVSTMLWMATHELSLKYICINSLRGLYIFMEISLKPEISLMFHTVPKHICPRRTYNLSITMVPTSLYQPFSYTLPVHTQRLFPFQKATSGRWDCLSQARGQSSLMFISSLDPGTVFSI